MPTRVVVTGGRRYGNKTAVESVFYRIQKKYGRENLVLICGMASGADMLAYCYCKIRWDWKCEEFYANWNVEGKAAGSLRNQRMVDAKPDFCVAFPGGKGTEDMKRRCRKAGVPIYEFK